MDCVIFYVLKIICVLLGKTRNVLLISVRLISETMHNLQIIAKIDSHRYDNVKDVHACLRVNHRDPIIESKPTSSKKRGKRDWVWDDLLLKKESNDQKPNHLTVDDDGRHTEFSSDEYVDDVLSSEIKSLILEWDLAAGDEQVDGRRYVGSNEKLMMCQLDMDIETILEKSQNPAIPMETHYVTDHDPIMDIGSKTIEISKIPIHFKLQPKVTKYENDVCDVAIGPTKHGTKYKTLPVVSKQTNIHGLHLKAKNTTWEGIFSLRMTQTSIIRAHTENHSTIAVYPVYRAPRSNERNRHTAPDPMINEWNRLASYGPYHGDGNVLRIAQCGFYHDKDKGIDWTKCVFCYKEYSNWKRCDNIQARHPRCPFYHSTTENIPIHGPNSANPTNLEDNHLNQEVQRYADNALQRGGPVVDLRNRIVNLWSSIQPWHQTLPAPSLPRPSGSYIPIDNIRLHERGRNAERHFQDAGRRFQDAGRHVQDAGSHVQDAGRRFQDAGRHFQDAGRRFQDAGRHVQDSGSHVQDAGRHFQDVGSHVQDAGRHFQDAGSHVQDVGPHHQYIGTDTHNQVVQLREIDMQREVVNQVSIYNPLSVLYHGSAENNHFNQTNQLSDTTCPVASSSSSSRPLSSTEQLAQELLVENINKRCRKCDERRHRVQPCGNVVCNPCHDACALCKNE